MGTRSNHVTFDDPEWPWKAEKPEGPIFGVDLHNYTQTIWPMVAKFDMMIHMGSDVFMRGSATDQRSQIFETRNFKNMLINWSNWRSERQVHGTELINSPNYIRLRYITEQPAFAWFSNYVTGKLLQGPLCPDSIEGRNWVNFLTHAVHYVWPTVNADSRSVCDNYPSCINHTRIFCSAEV